MRLCVSTLAVKHGARNRVHGGIVRARLAPPGPDHWGSPEAVPVRTSALSNPEPLVCGHAALALRRVVSAEAREPLASRSSVGPNEWVRSELVAALAPLTVERIFLVGHRVGVGRRSSHSRKPAIRRPTT